MTEQRSALDSALDLLLYAPVGLALTAAEELPKFAAKGRAQVQGQVSVAKMVGQFAVAQGRKEVEKRFFGPPRPAAPERPAGPTTPTPAARASGNGASRGAADDTSYERLAGRAESGAAVIDVDFGTTSRSGPGADGLAIPGYDSLSASQVVQRLAGLSQEELAAVGEYEAAHRGRRTILTRVGQLKG